jgi:hypothetical protein
MTEWLTRLRFYSIQGSRVVNKNEILVLEALYSVFGLGFCI